MVTAANDNGGLKKKTYEYDPHLDPQLQWAGKAEHTSFEVPTVSLHVHERIDPRRIIESVRKRDEENGGAEQPSLFETDKKPLREAIEFYKHKDQWSNRLIAGDSLLVMNSLLEKEGMGGKVQMVYFDPPYGIKYGSNFQPFVNKRDVKDGRDEDLTAEPEMIKAFRDTWELGIHSYLTYLRDRLQLAKELLHERGSIFVQISEENVHHVREVMDEVFQRQNFNAMIAFQKSGGTTATGIERMSDYLLWYAKDIEKAKRNKLYTPKDEGKNFFRDYCYSERADGTYERLPADELKCLPNPKLFRLVPCNSQHYSPTRSGPVEFEGRDFSPGHDRQWSIDPQMFELDHVRQRLVAAGNSLMYRLYSDETPGDTIKNMWTDTAMAGLTVDKIYAVQTSPKAVARCLLLSTEPGDLVLDITCGSGTTAYVAENWGRRWITCDTSRVATVLAKQRLMTGDFDYFELAHPDEGVGSGFKYKTVPHITLKSIANNEPAPQETLYDQPFTDNKKQRVTGPFTVEAVPAPYAKSPDEAESALPATADISVARSGETLRQGEWIARLRDGIRGKGGARIEFARMEQLGGTHYLQAEGQTTGDDPKQVYVCFGPEHAPLEQRLVEHALDEARSLVPKPEIIVFCAFQFDPEARKDIEETNWPGIQLLEAQMDADLQNEDLKKKPRDSSNPGFWLIGQPDVNAERQTDGTYTVEVRGFDYYNPKTGEVDSGGKADIAMWMLDPDYDDRSLFPTQVFFPMAGDKEGWSKLAKNLKAEIDEEKIEAFRGTVSLPFTPGRKVAVKIIDARGIESLKIIHI